MAGGVWGEPALWALEQADWLVGQREVTKQLVADQTTGGTTRPQLATKYDIDPSSVSALIGEAGQRKLIQMARSSSSFLAELR